MKKQLEYLLIRLISGNLALIFLNHLFLLGKRNYKLSSPNTATNLSVKSNICNIVVKVKI